MTATGELCAMSDLPADWCAHCVGEDPDAEPEWERTVVIIASYLSRCAGCDLPIEPGDDIVGWRDAVTDADPVWTHTGCTP